MNRPALKALLCVAAGLCTSHSADARQLSVAYPPLASQAGAHGSVAAVLVIGPSGAIESCSISRSSGSEELDKATCALATRNRKYPARDRRQPRPVIVVLVHWLLADTPPTPADLPVSPDDAFVLGRAGAPSSDAVPVSSARLIGWNVELPTSIKPGYEEVRPFLLVSVGADGRAEACSPLRVSGYPEIDRIACDQIVETATFKPGSNARGKAVPSLFGASLTFFIDGVDKSTFSESTRGAFASARPVRMRDWVAPRDVPATVDRRLVGATRLYLVVGPNGAPSSCRVHQSSNSSSLDSEACRLMMTRARFVPAVGPDGQKMAAVFTIRWVWGADTWPDRSHDDNDDAWTITLAQIPKGLTSAVIFLRYLVGPDGHLQRCEADRSSGVPSLDKAACDATANIQFERVVDETGKPLATVQTHHVRVTLAPAADNPASESGTKHLR
jgi:TonB family protein